MSIHVDLEAEIRRTQGTSLAILGSCYYPLEPALSGKQVADRLAERVKGLDSLLSESHALGGRWVIIFIKEAKSYLIHDPCGFRSVHYCPQEGCGSDPNLLRQVFDLEFDVDPDLKSFLRDPSYLKRESSWVGDGTLYKNCRRLMPNHYLDLHSYEAKRYFPLRALPQPRSLDEVVDECGDILQGSVAALANRGQIRIPLTAGLDSRLLLAASKPYKNELKYFVNCLSPSAMRTPDVTVAQQLGDELHLDFQVQHIDTQTPTWFNDILCENISRARSLPKTGAIFQALDQDYVNINGNGSEICRHLYRPFLFQPKHTGRKLSRDFARNGGSRYAAKALTAWLENLDPTLDYHPIDLLYWEQRMGNWGAHFPAEQDIAIEEVSPFNCRQFIDAMYCLPRDLRAGPSYRHYLRLLEKLWPETLKFPINPLSGLSVKHKVRDSLRRTFPWLAPVIYR